MYFQFFIKTCKCKIKFLYLIHFWGNEQLISESISENNGQFLVLWHVVRKEFWAFDNGIQEAVW